MRAGKKVFQDVSFSLEKGEILTILGPNGAGKSTLLNCLANLYRPDSGRILLNGKPLDSYKVRDVAKIMGYVPQNHVPAYAYSVRDFVVMGRAPYLGTFQQPSEEDYALTDQVLEEMGMSELAFRPYTNISGGERQQAVIARAIVQQSELILFDEPTNHLDYGYQLNMIQMIRRLADKGYSIILTTHMPDHAIILNGKVGVLLAGWKLLLRQHRGTDAGGTALQIVSQPASDRLCKRGGEKGLYCGCIGVLTEKLIREIYDVETQIIADNHGNPHIIYIP